MLENLFEEEIANLGLNVKFNTLLFCVLAASSAISILIFYFIQMEIVVEAIVCLAILLLPSILFFFFLEYLKDQKQKSIESQLPEVLFQIAAFPKNTSMEKIIESIAGKETVLGKEFKCAKNLIEAGFPVQESLSEISNNNSSMLLKRSVTLLLELYETGGELTQCLNEIAQDIFEMHSLQKEAQSAFSMQKYTLFAGICLFMPLILGLLCGVTSSLDFNMQDSIFGMKDNSALIDAIMLSIQIYLFLLSAIASAFMAMQEGRIKKAPVYFCMLFISGILVFNLVKGIDFV
jgi:pilus assembly protein TadC